MRRSFAALLFLMALGTSACGGGGGSATPGSGTSGGGGASLSIAPSSLSFASTSSAAQNVTLSATGNLGALNTSNGCSGIASLGGSGGSLPVTFTITPRAVGSCSITFSGGGASTTLSISVGGTGSGGGTGGTAPTAAPGAPVAVTFLGLQLDPTLTFRKNLVFQNNGSGQVSITVTLTNCHNVFGCTEGGSHSGAVIQGPGTIHYVIDAAVGSASSMSFSYSWTAKAFP